MAGHTFTRLPVTTDLGGSEIAVGLHELEGAADGPTLTILAGLHGSEWLPVEVIRRLLLELDPSALRGRVRIVPVANAPAFNHLTRNTPLEESDGPDLNRIFPGKRQTINELIAAVIADRVIAGSDFLIDLHFGIWGSTWYSADWPGDLPDQEMSRRSRGMAHAYGCELVYQQTLSGFPGTRSVMWYAATQLGVTPMGVELGGCGFAPEVEERWISMNVRGLLSVMRHLEMLPGDPIRLDRYLHYKSFRRMEPRVGGYLLTEVGPEHLGQEAPAGTVAGRVISPQDFRELEVITTPVRGVWRQVARSYPVRPGGWGYAVADLDEEGAGWGPAF